MICRSCSRANPAEAAFCAYCGKKIADAGASWAMDEVIAERTHARAEPVQAEPLQPPVVAPAQAAPTPASPRRRIKPTVLVAIGAVLAAALALGVPPLVRESRFRSNVDGLKSADASERADAAAALAAGKDPRAVELLAGAMADESADVREAAQEGLVAFGPDAVGTYLDLLSGEDPEACSGAIELALRLGDQSAVEPLCELLGDDPVDAATRKAAIEALVNLCSTPDDPTGHPPVGEPALVAPLIGAVDDKNESVRVAAIEGLAAFPSDKAVNSLIAVFRTSTPKTRKAAGKTLRVIGGASVHPLMCCAADARVSREAVALVRRIGPAHADQVVRAIQHKSPKVRKAAIGVVVGYRYKQDSAIRALILRLRKDPDTKVRIAAAEALGVFDASEAGDLLFTTLCKEGNKSLRAAAATALVRIWGAKDRALLYALRDRDTATVANLYKRFIRWGKSETLGIMSDAVMEHGHTTMVVDYLNCGSSQLDAAARRWCSNHGYRVISSSGSGWSGPSWGGS